MNSFIALKQPSEDALNERYATVERIKFELDSKYRLHPNNFVKMRLRDDYVLEL